MGVSFLPKMTSRTSRIFLSLFFLAIFFVAGCGKTKLDYPKMASEAGQGKVSENVNVDIYLDATLSMKGFVQPETATNFSQTIQVLEHAAVGVWPKTMTTFNKFGTRIYSMQGREHLQAVRPSFYESEINRETNISAVVAQASKDNLTVIVSDLFEKDADIVAISSELVKSYTTRDLSVGIMAIRSEFCGTVYDVGIQAKSFQYCPLSNDMEKQRPFYLLILGRYADVVKYAESLRESHKKLADSPFLVIQKQLIKEAGSLNKSISIDKLVEVSNILTTANTKEQSGMLDRIKQFEIKTQGEKATAVFPVTFERLPYTMPFDELKLETLLAKTHQYEERRSDWKNMWKKNITESAVAKETSSAISLQTQADPGSITGLHNLKMVVNGARLPLHSICRYDVVLRPSDASFLMPDWISAWDMDPGVIDGSKTLNLKLFISGVWRGTLQAQRNELGPRLASFQIYIKRDK